MSDNTPINAGSGGDTIRDLDRGIGAKTQVMVLDAGGASSSPESLVSAFNPLPTVDAVNAAAQSTDAPMFFALTGDPNGDFAGVKILEELVNDGSGFALNVKTINSPLSDSRGAAIASDAPVAIQLSGMLNSVIVIDTTGYQSLNITTQAMTATVSASDDGVSWSALTGAPRVMGILGVTIAANSGYSFPCIARYIRLTLTAGGTATAYLRSQPWNALYSLATSNNILQVASTTAIVAGVSGTFVTGGNVAPGAAATINPSAMGGVDSSNLTRRILTDASGRIQTSESGIDSAGTQRQIGVIPPAFQNVTAIATSIVDQFEGQSEIELLAQILIELRIMNQQLFTLPLNLNAGNSTVDEPSAFRSDSTSYTQ